MNFAFLMDPIDGIQPQKDTSFAFMEGAMRRGHRVFYAEKDAFSLRRGQLRVRTRRVEPDRTLQPPFVEHQATTLEGEEIDAVFIRTDPPFDQQYLYHTWLFDHLPARVPVINRPSGVRTVNEKIWAMRFTDLQPDTLLTQSYAEVSEFLATHGHTILKPTDGFGGMGVFHVRAGDTNARVIFETLSNHGGSPVIVQQYVPAAECGDKRILLLNGKPLGAVLRVHGDDDHRNNFFAGGQAKPAEITQRDDEIIATLAPHLLDLGLHFVGIDVIGDYLIEVNVTSPTCLQEMNAIYGRQLEDDVIAYVEKLCEEAGQ